VITLGMIAIAQTPTEPAPNAQSPSVAEGAQPQGSVQFPAGTVIQAELSKSIDAKKSKVGDKVEARVPSDLLAHGKIVVPRNTKIVGHITEIKAHTKESKDSRVGFAFDRLVMKDDKDIPLQAIVQAVARPLVSAAIAQDNGMSQGGIPNGGRVPPPSG